ncbi:hypothetical protein TcasGA2_TC002192 [Tribolium castaneum]|uniref:Uncharacterized protein n=1 Tax=Tribolium castaneum TaxID=7070 RepID=D6WXX4_TRICA|nr:hypothetical protein TcasGA2_TC002192 [Tribolium castaneum]
MKSAESTAKLRLTCLNTLFIIGRLEHVEITESPKGALSISIVTWTKNSTRKRLHFPKVWQQLLFDQMQEAGRAEKELAIKAGDISKDGVPFITVVTDGGWSHRSHGHRYNVNSGVACVIGFQTKKLLDVDVRNKYCSMCVFIEKNQKQASPYQCFKNWNANSSAMESDMLVQAFKRSKSLHRLEYRCFIGDGDSSVFKKLIENVEYRRHIEKIECANHAFNNYTKFILKTQVKGFTKGARAAIIYYSQTSQNPEDLKHDLKNGPYHVFEIHRNCKTYFCKEFKPDNEDTILHVAENIKLTIDYVQEASESNARKEYTAITGYKVRQCGFFIDLELSFIGASPDGLVNEDGIIEVKCPFSAKDKTIEEAVRNVSNFCLDKNKKLKRQPDYYYQVQTQFRVTNKKICDFVVWTEKDIYVNRIYPDPTPWDKILP